MHNNAAEQSIRGFCIGKKNWVMIDTVAGAKSSAIIYSIAETAKANNLKPVSYTHLRSFMFFSHALAVASCFQKPIRLIIPENGFISLNIPSTFSRIGTSSTRTTHPYYMTLFQKLLSIIELPVTLVNPYRCV